MGFYALTLAGSAYFAPVISGFIADYAGWKWVFYVPAIFSAVVTVFLFFFMEETSYHRPYVGTVESVESANPRTDVETPATGNEKVPDTATTNPASPPNSVHRKTLV